MWKRRLMELAIAGGVLSSGCGPGIFACNANPDPCCREPDSQACIDYKRRDMAIRNTGEQDLSPRPDLAHHD